MPYGRGVAQRMLVLPETVGVQPLPVPTGPLEGTPLAGSGNKREDLADIVVMRIGATPFTLPGPVYLFAYATPQQPYASVPDLPNADWINSETIELSSMDLNDRGKMYRIHVSPWWERITLVAPAWLFAVGQEIQIAYRPYV
jgi:hypothetical protein